MISKLPRWVWLGGGLLAFNAGMVNVTALLGLEHQAVSHVTGSLSRMGMELATGAHGTALLLTAVVGSFLAGAVVSGLLIKNSALQFGRTYGVALMIEGLLLALAIPLLRRHLILGDCLASAACGLQNAMATTYSGTVLRTTHVTGVLTDLGIALGRFFSGLGLDVRRIRLLGTIFVGFLVGSFAGALAYSRFEIASLAFPAVLCGCAGLAYTAARLWRGPQGEQTPPTA